MCRALAILFFNSCIITDIVSFHLLNFSSFRFELVSMLLSVFLISFMFRIDCDTMCRVRETCSKKLDEFASLVEYHLSMVVYTFHHV